MKKLLLSMLVLFSAAFVYAGPSQQGGGKANYLVLNTINPAGAANTIREVTGKGTTLLFTNSNPMNDELWKLSDKVWVVSSIT